ALYSRSRWQFVEASSEAPEEGETNGGLGSHAIDGNSLSFWHSQWAGGEVAGPHYLIFDLGATVTLHGLSFIGRQSDNDGKPEEVVVSISNDYGQTWEDIDTLYLDNINAEKRFLLDDFKECNYIKITINTQHGGVVYSHLAEIAAF
nr:discoidin domain-containing protein [Salinivirgaceae bacterium]